MSHGRERENDATGRLFGWGKGRFFVWGIPRQLEHSFPMPWPS